MSQIQKRPKYKMSQASNSPKLQIFFLKRPIYKTFQIQNVTVMIPHKHQNLSIKKRLK